MPSPKILISHARLKELVHYNPETGDLTSLIRRCSAIGPGQLLGCKNAKGYLQAKIDGRLYVLHRLIWFMMTGTWPPELIDHRDRNRANNRWENLRLATFAQNCQNRGVRQNTISGVVGVNWVRVLSKWRAQIKINGKSINLGNYVLKEDAIAARKAAELKFYGDFAQSAYTSQELNRTLAV